MRNFTINNKRFKDKYLDAIKFGIKIKYKELYPNNKITLSYNKNGWDDIYNFTISISLKTFSKKDGNLINKLLELESYTNIEAINLFSKINIEEYLEEYDDSRKDYKQQLKDFIETTIVTYKLLNVNILEYGVTNDKYYIKLDLKQVRLGYNNFITASFIYDVLTEEEFNNIKKAIINSFNNKIKYIEGKAIW